MTQDSLQVLIAEDDPVHRRMLDALLVRWGHEVKTVGDGAAALAVLREAPSVRLVIADWMMPELDGLALCREIRENFNQPYVYIILLTARDRHDDVVAGLDAGADDYLIKPVHHNELNARIRAAKRIIDLQSQLLAAQEELRIQAMHDSLTGIFNRGAVFNALVQELDRAERQSSPLAVAMIDLDHFKRVNDTHGHLIGDDVLREAATRIRNSVRSYDAVGRYGGEEFLVVAPGMDARQAIDLAERIRRQFEDHPIQTRGPDVSITSSLGVVILEAGRKPDINNLLDAADQALYRAKQKGRNATVLGEP